MCLKSHSSKDIELLKLVHSRSHLSDCSSFITAKNWDTPYKYKDLRVPIRIRVTGESKGSTAKDAISDPVDQINDFSYFKPTISDLNKLLVRRNDKSITPM